MKYIIIGNAFTKLKELLPMPSLLPIFSLRIPEELLDQIKQIASENCRSTNKEIEYALTQYVKQYHKTHQDEK
jgi:hypothetical protein